MDFLGLLVAGIKALGSCDVGATRITIPHCYSQKIPYECINAGRIFGCEIRWGMELVVSSDPKFGYSVRLDPETMTVGEPIQTIPEGKEISNG